MLVRPVVLELIEKLLGPRQSPKPDGADVLKNAGDVLKVSTGLATGTLVFSLGLLDKAAGYPDLARLLLAASWGLLVVSVIFGLLSQAAIPPLLEEGRYSLEEKTFTWPGRLHQTALILAVILLGVTLGLAVFDAPPAVPSAGEAVERARKTLRPGERIVRLSELSAVAPASPDAGQGWRIGFELAAPPGRPAYADVLIDAKTGRATRVQ